MKGNEEVVCPARLRPEDPVEIYEPFVPRNMKITKAIINKFGYSRRCPRCRALTQGEASTTLAHSRECLERIEQQIRSDSELTKHALKLQRSAKHVTSQERLNDLHRQVPLAVRKWVQNDADDEMMEDVGELPFPSCHHLQVHPKLNPQVHPYSLMVRLVHYPTTQNKIHAKRPAED